MRPKFWSAAGILSLAATNWAEARQESWISRSGSHAPADGEQVVHGGAGGVGEGGGGHVEDLVLVQVRPGVPGLLAGGLLEGLPEW